MTKKKRYFPGVLLSLLDHAFEYLTMLLVTAILIIIPLQVFCRFVLHSSLSWPDEMGPYILAWITFVGAVLAMRKDEHIRFDVIVDKVPHKLRFSILVFRDLICITFLSVLFLYSIPIVKVKWPDLAYTFPVSKGLIYSCVTLGSLLMLILTVVSLVRTIKEYCKKKS